MIVSSSRRFWTFGLGVFLLCLASAASAWYLNTVQLQLPLRRALPAAAALKFSPYSAKSVVGAGTKRASAYTKPHFAGDSTPTPPPYIPVADPLPDVQLLRFVLQKGKEGIPVL